mgnify:CR=1 FL=1
MEVTVTRVHLETPSGREERVVSPQPDIVSQVPELQQFGVRLVGIERDGEFLPIPQGVQNPYIFSVNAILALRETGP